LRAPLRAGLFAELASRAERGTEQEFAEALRQIAASADCA
jgi:hypothetical protein